MKRLALGLLLLLAACVPTFGDGSGIVTFEARGGQLIMRAPAPILHASAAVAGAVTSPYEVGTEGPYTLLRLPEGRHGQRALLGRYTGEVEGFGTVYLEGGRAGLDVELETP